MGDGSHAEVVANGHSELPDGAATEVTLEAVRQILAGVAGIDWATEVTQELVLAAIAAVRDAGIITTPTSAPLAVTAVSQLALAANADRLTALFINDGANTIYLMEGAAAVANQGIRLNANGGSYQMSQPIGNLYRGAVYAIAAVAGPTNLLVKEGV